MEIELTVPNGFMLINETKEIQSAKLALLGLQVAPELTTPISDHWKRRAPRPFTGDVWLTSPPLSPRSEDLLPSAVKV